MAFLGALSLSTLSAQAKEQHKVVIIEKEVNDNGEVVKKKVIKEGDEAKEYIEKMDPELLGSAEKQVKMIKKEAYEIKVEDDNGEVKVLKWDGEGEMPAEMKELMQQEGMLGELDAKDAKSRIRIKKKGAELEDIMDLEFEGDELPDEVREILEKEGIDLEQIVDGEGNMEIRVVSKKEHDEANDRKKAQLGVNIENHPNGVFVSDVVKDSSADDGGLKKGDIITAVDGQPMIELSDLVSKIATYSAGDEVTVDFIRARKPQTAKFVLKERVELFPYKTWEEVMELNKGSKEETIEIEIEREVIKEKK